MMQPFKKITSPFVSLPRSDIDTDLIIPAEFLTSVSRTGYGEHLFKRLRDSDPQFPLNQPELRRASVLVAGSNFGCGSSREHAVWALLGWGFRVIIAESFADIFTENSAKNGLLLVKLTGPEINRLLCAPESTVLTVDLERREVIMGEGTALRFEYDPFKKHCLMNGIDELDYLLAARDKIATFFSRATIQKFQRPVSQS